MAEHLQRPNQQGAGLRAPRPAAVPAVLPSLQVGTEAREVESQPGLRSLLETELHPLWPQGPCWAHTGWHPCWGQEMAGQGLSKPLPGQQQHRARWRAAVASRSHGPAGVNAHQVALSPFRLRAARCEPQSSSFWWTGRQGWSHSPMSGQRQGVRQSPGDRNLLLPQPGPQQNQRPGAARPGHWAPITQLCEGGRGRPQA